MEKPYKAGKGRPGGHDRALMDELSEFGHLFWDWVDRSKYFSYNYFLIGEEHRGMSLLIA